MTFGDVQCDYLLCLLADMKHKGQYSHEGISGGSSHVFEKLYLTCHIENKLICGACDLQDFCNLVILYFDDGYEEVIIRILRWCELHGSGPFFCIVHEKTVEP